MNPTDPTAGSAPGSAVGQNPPDVRARAALARWLRLTYPAGASFGRPTYSYRPDTLGKSYRAEYEAIMGRPPNDRNVPDAVREQFTYSPRKRNGAAVLASAQVSP